MLEEKALNENELEQAAGGICFKQAGAPGLKCPFCKQNAMKPSGKGFVCGNCGLTCNKEQLEV